MWRLQSCNHAAMELGYTNVAHMSAGISGWKEAGEALAVK